jgi:hypothetical protein
MTRHVLHWQRTTLRDLPARARQLAAGHILDECRRAFEATRNPAFAWTAVTVAEDGVVALPAWVRAVLVEAARLVAEGDNTGAAMVLGLKRQGASARSSARTSWRDRQLAHTVAWRLRDAQQRGQKSHLDKECGSIARDAGVSKATVRAAYDTWRGFLDL